MPPLTDETPVFRAVTDPSWIGGNTVDSAAFFRRKKVDVKGISIGASSLGCRANLTRPVDGVIIVNQVGCVRRIVDPEGQLPTPLDVVMDDYPHGNIENVPYKEKKGPRRALANRIASLLARCSDVHERFDPPQL